MFTGFWSKEYYLRKGGDEMLATTASATAATRLQRILKEHGIASQIIGTPAVLSAGGCSYSLRFFDTEKRQDVLHLAASHGIRIRALWKETDDPDMPYVKIYG